MRMPRLNWVFAGCTFCYLQNSHKHCIEFKPFSAYGKNGFRTALACFYGKIRKLSNEPCHETPNMNNMFLWRTEENYPLIIIKYPPYLFLWIIIQTFALEHFRAHKANSHAKFGWQTFTDSVIKLISDNCSHVVFILWGGFAHKKEKLIDTKKHGVVKTAHPSPLSAGKFKNCGCFSSADKLLKSFGQKAVDWSL